MIRLYTGNEGKAGMAAIVFRNDQTSNLDLILQDLSSYIVKHLPSYARPMFLRVMTALPVTGTFKHEKTRLSQEAFDTGRISEPLYVMDLTLKRYMPFTDEKLLKITAGKAKL